MLHRLWVTWLFKDLPQRPPDCVNWIICTITAALLLQPLPLILSFYGVAPANHHYLLRSFCLHKKCWIGSTLIIFSSFACQGDMLEPAYLLQRHYHLKLPRFIPQYYYRCIPQRIINLLTRPENFGISNLPVTHRYSSLIWNAVIILLDIALCSTSCAGDRWIWVTGKEVMTLTSTAENLYQGR